MRSRLFIPCVFFFLCLSVAASAGPSGKRKAWITMGVAAFRQAKAVAPELVSIEARQLRVAGASERVHAVVMDEAKLVEIVGAIHQRSGRRGGFMYHTSEAEARAALDRHRVSTPLRSYDIRRREVVEPMLATMQEKNIEATILALSAFTNRYYASPSGVEAAHWLLSAWRELAAGREDIVVAPVVHQAFPQPSVTLTIAGTDLADEHIVIGAHLDSILGIGMSKSAQAP